MKWPSLGASREGRLGAQYSVGAATEGMGCQNAADFDASLLQSVDSHSKYALLQVVALVGPSGGGKSSIVKLVERFYLPSSGAVMLDGRDVGLYDAKWLKRNVALVAQVWPCTAPLQSGSALNHSQHILQGGTGTIRADLAEDTKTEPQEHQIIMHVSVRTSHSCIHVCRSRCCLRGV